MKPTEIKISETEAVIVEKVFEEWVDPLCGSVVEFKEDDESFLKCMVVKNSGEYSLIIRGSDEVNIKLVQKLDALLRKTGITRLRQEFAKLRMINGDSCWVVNSNFEFVDMMYKTGAENITNWSGGFPMLVMSDDSSGEEVFRTFCASLTELKTVVDIYLVD